MPEPSNSLQLLFEQAKQGSEQAKTELVQQLREPLLRVIRRHLKQQVRSKVDSTDILQEVVTAFFLKCLERYEFTTADALLAFLTGTTKHKVAEIHRHYLDRQKCDVRREQRLDQPPGALPLDLPDPSPTPYEAAATDDEWQHLLSGQPMAYQDILVQLGAGYTPREVAEDLGISERTVRRLMERLAALGVS